MKLFSGSHEHERHFQGLDAYAGRGAAWAFSMAEEAAGRACAGGAPAAFLQPVFTAVLGLLQVTAHMKAEETSSSSLHSRQKTQSGAAWCSELRMLHHLNMINICTMTHDTLMVSVDVPLACRPHTLHFAAA